ncbi:MAG: 50S ribosomal protein L18 [Rhodospirillales bacterium]|nr:50S ribosomal protein L18 [Rhodospirillales bacterium]
MARPNRVTQRRVQRTRGNIRRVAGDRMRLSVFRSDRHIYAQIIDDQRGVTLAHASTLEEGLRSKLKNGATRDAAGEIGKLIAERARKAGVERVVFDRGGYRFHGRIKALAEAARQTGLQF